MDDSEEEIETHTLTRVDRAILDKLREGRATKGALTDWTGFSRNSLYNRLEILEAKGLITCDHEGTRLFSLRHDPREGGSDESV